MDMLTIMEKIVKMIKIRRSITFRIAKISAVGLYTFLVSSGSLQASKELFIEARCVRCHSIMSEGVEPLRSTLREGKKIRDLSSSGGHHDKEWIKKWLKQEVRHRGKRHPAYWKGPDDKLDEIAEFVSNLKSKIPESQVKAWLKELVETDKGLDLPKESEYIEVRK